MRKVIITISLLLLTFILGAQEMPLSSYYFYVAVYREDVKWVQKHLEAGYNPNKCRGEAGWYDSKPLKVLIEQLIGAYKSYIEGSVVIYPSIEVFKLLTKYGVNVNQLPYVWDRIHKYDNAYLNRILKYDKDKLTAENTNKKDEIQDINRLLEALLDAGADPNTEPIGHFFQDMLPYYKWGNSPEDPTTDWERMTGSYQGDVSATKAEAAQFRMQRNAEEKNKAMERYYEHH